jgi:hypothetical protein
LWNADPRLDQLVQIQASKDDWLNVRETNFVGQSTARKRQNKILLWGSVGVVTLGSLAFSTAIWLQLQATSLREKATRVENLLTTSPVEALVLAIEATGKSQSIINPFLDDNLLNSVKSSLFQAFVAGNERHAAGIHQCISIECHEDAQWAVRRHSVENPRISSRRHAGTDWADDVHRQALFESTRRSAPGRKKGAGANRRRYL